MKTYYDNGYLYYYDTSLKCWAICQADEMGNFLNDEIDYSCVTKNQLKIRYPMLTFIKAKFPKRDWKNEMKEIVKSLPEIKIIKY